MVKFFASEAPRSAECMGINDNLWYAVGSIVKVKFFVSPSIKCPSIYVV